LRESRVCFFEKRLASIDLNSLIYYRLDWAPCTSRQIAQRIQRLFAHLY